MYIIIGVLQQFAAEYCGGAAVTKFPTKYFRIEHGIIHGLKCAEW